MFSSLKSFSDEQKLQMGKEVILLPATYLAIAEREDIGQTPFADTPILIRDFLVDWCSKNIKGRWKHSLITVDQRLAFQFTFQKKSEAVRFKLVWGGK
jgi:hypothetical protein